MYPVYSLMASWISSILHLTPEEDKEKTSTSCFIILEVFSKVQYCIYLDLDFVCSVR